ncbi:MAG: hypothetical protein M3O09_06235 [Acidobacteriota bacterium]|nr:hypothetical protein [Acidobacteriota bacterium]
MRGRLGQLELKRELWLIAVSGRNELNYNRQRYSAIRKEQKLLERNEKVPMVSIEVAKAS